jgi:cysteine desulfurase
MDIPYSRAMGAIRFSLGRFNTDSEVETLLDVLPGIVEDVRRMAEPSL